MKIAVNGLNINVRERGRGAPSLVFLHYWGGSSRTWEEVVDSLEGQHQCIAIDHRGWGESDAPSVGYSLTDLANDAQGVITTLGLQHYWIVGHSMGGKVGQLLASRRPPGLAGLVLVGPSPPAPTILPEEQRQAVLHAYDSRESITHVRDQILTALPLTEEQKERVVEDSLRGSAAARHAWPTEVMAQDIRSQVKRINVPTLVVSGERDQVDPVARLREDLLPFIDGARLQVLPRAGHLAMLEDPHGVAEAIRQFVARPG